METRAHHILIGVFMLTMVAGIFAFVIWALKVGIDAKFALYDIYYEESVSGLSVGSAVTYRGVNVGKVRKIALDADDPSRVRVTIRVAADTPVREDSVASLELLGLTGLSVVQISGGTAAAAPLQAKTDEPNPVIPSEPSQIQELFIGAPNLINAAIVLANNVAAAFNKDNREALGAILANGRVASAALADQSGHLGEILANAERTLTDLQQASQSVDRLADVTTGLVDGDVRGLVGDLREASASLRELSLNLNSAVDENGKALAAFSSNTLPEVALFVAEARRAATAISRIAEKLERSPTDFIFSGKKPEYEAK